MTLLPFTPFSESPSHVEQKKPLAYWALHSLCLRFYTQMQLYPLCFSSVTLASLLFPENTGQSLIPGTYLFPLSSMIFKLLASWPSNLYLIMTFSMWSFPTTIYKMANSPKFPPLHCIFLFYFSPQHTLSFNSKTFLCDSFKGVVLSPTESKFYEGRNFVCFAHYFLFTA